MINVDIVVVSLSVCQEILPPAYNPRYHYTTLDVLDPL